MCALHRQLWKSEFLLKFIYGKMWYSCLINITNALLGGRDMYMYVYGTRIAKHIYEMRKKKLKQRKT